MEKRNEFPRSILDQKFNEHVTNLSQVVGFKEKVQGSKINKYTKRKEDGVFAKWELVTVHVSSFIHNKPLWKIKYLKLLWLLQCIKPKPIY